MSDQFDEKKKATRESWKKLQSLPETTAEIYLQRKFYVEEFRKICIGLIPRQMEDKWFIFFEEPRLYLHRSWTGQCIYEIEFTRENEFFVVARALVNRDKDQYKNSDDKYDEALLLFLIENLLLGNRTPFPLKPDADNTYPAGALQHNIAGTAYEEKEM